MVKIGLNLIMEFVLFVRLYVVVLVVCATKR